MDDYDIELTPNDPEFGPDECESTYALWAFKEKGEPVRFLEASLVENPDYPSGYSFFWRSLSLCDRTGKLVEGEGGDIGDVSRADHVADMVLPGGTVFSHVEDDSLPNLPYSFEERDLGDSARKSAAEAIRGAILSLPLSIAETTIAPASSIPCCATGAEWPSRSRPSSSLRRRGCHSAASCST